MLLPNSREQNPENIATTPGVGKISLHNSGRPTYGGVTITPGKKKVKLSS
jgi:hypothetical protein